MHTDEDRSYFVMEFPIHPTFMQKREQEGDESGARPESQPESSTSPVPVQYQSLEDRILVILSKGESPIAIISQKLGQKRVSGQLKVVLKKMLTENHIEYTIPDKPNSRLQKYRLTEKGRKVKANL